MRTYLLNLWDTVRSGYWFVPSILAVVAVVLSMAMPWVDEYFKAVEYKLPEWIVTTTDTARTTLSALAGATIGVTGTVFSITIVTLSLTSQQFGPRLLRRFMYDLTTQFTLGALLATGFYCLLILRVVENHEDGLVAPHLSVLMGVVLAGLSMVMLIIFIHHVAVMIQAPTVVAAVATDLDDAIDRIFPEKIGEPGSGDGMGEQVGQQIVARLSDHPMIVPSRHEGYLQAIDAEGLMLLAVEQDLILRLQSEPGDFIAREAALVEVWPRDERRIADLDADRLSDRLNEMFITGNRRTPRQDVICAVNELVEVAVRSLSPGINDPFTANNCIDRLRTALSRIADRQLPSRYRFEEEGGQLRVIANPVTFPGVLDAAFDQIRQYGRGAVSVTIRLLEAMGAIAGHVQRESDREALKRQAEMIVQQAEAIPDEPDRQAVRRKYEAFEGAMAT